MPDGSSLNKTAKIASIILLLANYALTVNAAPLGAAEMTASRFYWILLLILLAVLSLIYYFSSVKSPVQVLGLAYDKANHKLELTVKNGGDERYCIKSALRLLQPAEELAAAAVADGRIPMASARVAGGRKMFQLLCEDDSPVTLEPNETRTLSYEVLLPAEHLKLDASKNVEVHISYNGEDEAPLSLSGSGPEASDGFCIKLSSGEVIAEAFLLEDLASALKSSPEDAVVNHLREGNEFAAWVRTVVGDGELADKLENVQYSTPTEAKAAVLKVLDEKTESLRHPYLRKVSLDKSFILKTDHGSILSEVLRLEELAEKIASSPPEAVAFHTRDGNDFSAWIRDAVGDAELSLRVSGLSGASAEETRNRVVSAIRERVDSLQ